MPALKRLIMDIIGLLFPSLCNACGKALFEGEKEICMQCLFDLPYTDYHIHAENRVAKQLWGRFPFHAAMAMLYFKKGSRVQNLIHSLKYKGKTEVGVRLGGLMGTKLKTSEQYNYIDLIIPVPLHPKKQRQRGYNQSEVVANGLGKELDVKVSTAHLIRNRATSTQTKKSRYTRYENMNTVFSVQKQEQIQNLHVLLVDDVVTTGATLEACSLALLDAGVKKISIAAIAFAE